MYVIFPHVFKAAGPAQTNVEAVSRTAGGVVEGSVPRRIIPGYDIFSRMQDVEIRLQRIEDTMVTKADMERMRLETNANMERMERKGNIMFGVTFLVSLFTPFLGFYNTFIVNKKK